MLMYPEDQRSRGKATVESTSRILRRRGLEIGEGQRSRGHAMAEMTS